MYFRVVSSKGGSPVSSDPYSSKNIVLLFYTSKYFLIEIILPNAPIPVPKIKYTVIISPNISEKVSKLNPIFENTSEDVICPISELYAIPSNNTEISAATTPIIIPSTINGHLMKPFVAPTYFIIEISFLLACTVSFIVFAIMNTDITISSTSITAETILTPFVTFISASIVLSLSSIFFTFSKPSICAFTSSDFSSFVNVTTKESVIGLSSPVYASSILQICL